MATLATNANSANRTQVPVSTTPGVLLAENRDRKGYAVLNNGTGILYIADGVIEPSLATDYSYSVAAGGMFLSTVDFTGPVWCFWSATGGTVANVTEYS